jgi:MFS family permease
VSGLCLVTALGALIVFFLDDYEKEGITQAQISGLLTYPSLFLGVGNIVSMPLAIAVGRRPVLLLSLLLLFISGILCATNQSFAWHLAARSVAAFSAAQCMALVLLIIQVQSLLCIHSPFLALLTMQRSGHILPSPTWPNFPALLLL